MMTRMFVFDPSYIKRVKAKVDYWGIGMLAVWIGRLQIVLDKGQEKDWFATTWITVLSSSLPLLCLGFIIRELRARDPVVQSARFQRPQLFHRRFLDVAAWAWDSTAASS